MTAFQSEHLHITSTTTPGSIIDEDFLTVAATTSASALIHRFLERGQIIDSSSNVNIMYNASASVFEQCSQDAVPLQCISDRLEYLHYQNAQDGNTWLLIFSAALIFFMQAGFAMLCAGCVRIKNVGTFSPCCIIYICCMLLLLEWSLRRVHWIRMTVTHREAHTVTHTVKHTGI